MSGTNHFMDERANWLKPIAVFVLDHPMLIFVLIVSGILLHAYSSTRIPPPELLPQPSNVPSLDKNESSSASLDAPRILLNYRWRSSNDDGHQDPIRMPLEFRNLGRDIAVNVELEIRYLKWTAKFPTIPHLAPSESKSAVVNLEYDGYDLAGLSADSQFISLIKPPGEDALKQSRRVPAVVKYRDMHGNDFVSEYEFRWDHEKQEALALLVGYRKTQSSSSGPIPDVALVWDWPDEVKRNGGVLGMAREKDILIHNRSDQYVYNVQVESVKLHQELSFDLINEIAPREQHRALGRWNGKSSLTTSYVYFFGNGENEKQMSEKGWVYKKTHNRGLSELFVKIPMAITYESQAAKWRCEFEFIYDIGDESLFVRKSGQSL